MFTSRDNDVELRSSVVDNSDDDSDDDHDDAYHHYGDEPWKTLLKYPARASWRVSSPRPPPDFAQALQKIFEGRSNRKQFQRTLLSIMEQHKELSERRERERLRVIQNREYKSVDKKKDLHAKSVMYAPAETLAAFYYRMYPQYAVALRVLMEAKSLLGYNKNWSPKRVLDFGSGCGSASVASLHVFPGDAIEWIHGIDPSQTMREGAALFLEELLNHRTNNDEDAKNNNNNHNRPRTTFSAHIAESSGSYFDLALFSYTACELPHNQATLAAAATLWEKLRPNGLFVMIEPGTPDGFSSVRMVRNMLLDCCNNEDDDDDNDDNDPSRGELCRILAPCTHNGPCPMDRWQHVAKKKEFKTQRDVEKSDSTEKKDDDSDDERIEELFRDGFCSFVQTMPGNSAGKGEKFSYLVAQKICDGEFLPSQESTPMDDANLQNLLQRTVVATINKQHPPQPYETLHTEAVALEHQFVRSDSDPLGLELICGDDKRESFGRILRAPIKKRGHVYIESCVSPGKIIRYKISKSMSKRIPGLYHASRKSRWGGLWPNVPELKG